MLSLPKKELDSLFTDEIVSTIYQLVNSKYCFEASSIENFFDRSIKISGEIGFSILNFIAFAIAS